MQVRTVHRPDREITKGASDVLGCHRTPASRCSSRTRSSGSLGSAEMRIDWAVEFAGLELERRDGGATLELKVHEESSLEARLVRAWSGFLQHKLFDPSYCRPSTLRPGDLACL